MSDNEILWWTMAANVVVAAGTILTAGIALFAALAWRKGLEQQRIDECIMAIHDCGSAIGRVISHKGLQAQGKGTPWEFVPEVWTLWRRFRSSYAVMRRYRKKLPDVIEEGFLIIRRMEAFCHEPGGGNPEHGNQINHDFGQLRHQVSTCMR